MTSLPSPLRGIIPPMITPLLDRDTLDTGGLERLIEHILKGGVSGLFILGTSGEGPSLSYRLRGELITRTCRQVAARVPVLVGVTDTAFVESLNLAQAAAAAGAAAVVLAPPPYFPLEQLELCSYLDHLVPELPLPLFLYNMPGLTKLAFDPATVRRAMDHPGIVGLKDSSGDLNYFRQLCELLPRRTDWTLLMGPEELLVQAMALGAHGGVCGGANVFPLLYVELWQAAHQRDADRVEQLQAQVVDLADHLYGPGRRCAAVLKGMKCALACLDICTDLWSEPYQRAEEEQKRRIQTFLERVRALPCQTEDHRTTGPQDY